MITGTDIIGHYLLADERFTSKVAEKSLRSGRLPDDAPLPAVLLRSVSGSDRQFLKRTGYDRVTERIAVTVRAVSYAEQREIIRLIRNICSGKTGDVETAKRTSSLTAGLGPDLNGPGNTFEQTQDFRVSYDDPVEDGE